MKFYSLFFFFTSISGRRKHWRFLAKLIWHLRFYWIKANPLSSRNFRNACIGRLASNEAFSTEAYNHPSQTLWGQWGFYFEKDNSITLSHWGVQNHSTRCHSLLTTYSSVSSRFAANRTLDYLDNRQHSVGTAKDKHLVQVWGMEPAGSNMIRRILCSLHHDWFRGIDTCQVRERIRRYIVSSGKEASKRKQKVFYSCAFFLNGTWVLQ